VYLHVLIKDLDGFTVQNVKMGKHFIPFSAPFLLDTSHTCFGFFVCRLVGVFPY